ncbi:hypothetical protein MLD38_031229 [Melastoma candidum]|uniref:Uncharacterized protein n=1 Tax=Melastoma candidum TaxID=119954 RepID=A0ACB9MTX8_9MYRT|nr:hypothetical protein MLD38_031229 [Melastoma candidum]
MRGLLGLSPPQSTTFLSIRRRQQQQQPPRPSSGSPTSLPPKEKEVGVDHISSVSNPFVKHCVRLRCSSSHRRSHRSLLLVGTTPIREVRDYGNLEADGASLIDCLLVREENQVPAEFASSATCVIHVSPLVMEKISGVETSDSTEMVAVMRMPSTFVDLNNDGCILDCERLFPSPRRILVLDAIQDPGNLGTLLRSAAAFNWDGVLLLPGCCDPFNDKAIRASRGAAFRLPVVMGTWDHVEALVGEFKMKLLAGHPEGDGGQEPVSALCDSLISSLTDLPICLVLGSEGRGLSDKSKTSCELVSLHMSGKFESLNVSVAGGIFMFMLQSRKY